MKIGAMRMAGGAAEATLSDVDAILGGAAGEKPGAARSKKAAKPNAKVKTKDVKLGGGRFLLVALVFAGAMGAAALRLADMASRQGVEAPPPAPLVAAADRAETPARAAIVDRNGLPIAGSVDTYELYFDIAGFSYDAERDEAAETIAAAFPDRWDPARLKAEARRLKEKDGRGTITIAKRLTPRQAERAHNLGVPGLYLEERVDRVYHAHSAPHVVGWVGVDGEGGAGVEKALDARLRGDPTPLALSLDLRVQDAAAEALTARIDETGAVGGAAIVMLVETGEILALVSAPGFDPLHLPSWPKEAPETSPLFNRAVAGRYEMGSVMKLVTWAMALEERIADFDDAYPRPKPFKIGGHTIEDEHIKSAVSFEDALARSSNVVAAKLALEAGRERQERMLARLGFFAPTRLELPEAGGAAPARPHPWNTLAVAVAGYGYGVATTPLHMATTAATLVGGGARVHPTILKRAPGETGRGARVIRPETSLAMRQLMRRVATHGSGKRANPDGLEAGGKTGTADKKRPPPESGYFEDKVIASYVAAFPMSSPKVVVLVTLDEPEIMLGGEAVRFASATAAPAAGAIVARVAPLLGVAPRS